jgi:phosphomannomutase
MSSPTRQESEALFRGRRPTALAFGTSGLRGLVTDITDLEAYVNTRGFLDYLFTIGEVHRGDVVCIAGDRRPSTESPERSIMRAAARAIEDVGLGVDNLGRIPTPALAYYALQNGRASVMITGSHIPFDRNGIKFNKRSGEVLKADESGILDAVAAVRRAAYGRPNTESPFQDDGMFKPGEGRPLPPVNEEAQKAYRRRFVEFFPAQGLQGKRVVFFQHSAVGRDLFVELLEAFGAEVHPAGRSEEFIAIDTEDIPAERLDDLQKMADEVARSQEPVDAVLSTDGDSDRPLLCGVDAYGTVRFYGGDLLGIVVADYLDAHSISVPISANDAVDIHFGHRGVTPAKTKIGSPYVIKSMHEAQSSGARHVVGWEANGGFLLGSAVQKNGRSLEPLPTRDAALPLLAALFSSIENECSLVELFAQLPPRFSKAGLIDEFPAETSRALVQRFSPRDGDIKEVRFEGDGVTLHRADGKTEAASGSWATEQRAIRDELGRYFATDAGFGCIVGINTIDGVRIFFDGGDIAHIRPSGNAPQLRLYACADTQARADEIVAMGIREPDGLLRRLEASVTA